MGKCVLKWLAKKEFPAKEQNIKNKMFIRIPRNNQRAKDREKADECKEDVGVNRRQRDVAAEGWARQERRKRRKKKDKGCV